MLPDSQKSRFVPKRHNPVHNLSVLLFHVHKVEMHYMHALRINQCRREASSVQRVPLKCLPIASITLNLTKNNHPTQWLKPSHSNQWWENQVEPAHSHWLWHWKKNWISVLIFPSATRGQLWTFGRPFVVPLCWIATAHHCECGGDDTAINIRKTGILA